MVQLYRINNIQSWYKHILSDISKNGEIVTSRGMPVRELRNVIIEIEDPSKNLCVGIGRNLNTRIAAAESLQLIAGLQYPHLLSSISSGRFDAYRDGGAFHGAYGPRIAPQMPRVIDRLESDRGTRQAVVTIWDPKVDLYLEGLHDLPCTIGFTFHIRGDRLHMTTHMRSNDAWLGLPYDVFQFTELMHTVANITGFYPGTYTHIADSMHLYKWQLEKVERLTEPTEITIGPEGVWDAISWAEAAQNAKTLIEGGLPPGCTDPDADDLEHLNYDWYLEQVRHESWKLT